MAAYVVHRGVYRGNTSVRTLLRVNANAGVDTLNRDAVVPVFGRVEDKVLVLDVVVGLLGVLDVVARLLGSLQALPLGLLPSLLFLLLLGLLVSNGLAALIVGLLDEIVGIGASHANGQLGARGRVEVRGRERHRHRTGVVLGLPGGMLCLCLLPIDVAAAPDAAAPGAATIRRRSPRRS